MAVTTATLEIPWVTKTCNKCELTKPVEDFARHSVARYKRHPDCKDCRNKHLRSRYHADEGNFRSNTLARTRKYRFGLSQADYEAFKSEMGNACQICAVTDDLCIDHDHETGELRGLLCKRCNSGIGFFADKPDLLNAAISYLAHFRGEG